MSPNNPYGGDRPPYRRPGVHDRVDALLDVERRRLLEEAGLSDTPARHFRRPPDHHLEPEERDRVTLLFGGLTRRHDRLVQAAAEGLGYRIEVLPTPTKADYQTGREYCDNGMCNPVYFCAGALINHLKRLRDERGVPLDRIQRDYAYITASSCGPCRFGMYESQYRLALANSGFEGLRVVLFQQNNLNQSGRPAAVELNLSFFLALLNAVLIGDALNDMAHRIRPYEAVPGETDRVFDLAADRMCAALREKPGRPRVGRAWAWWAGALLPAMALDAREQFADQLLADHYTGALRECAALIDGIEVDYTRPKPVCKIVGEFWAQTTDGDGNFRMFSFLEEQGAQVWVEPVVTWVAYILHQAYAGLETVRGLKKVPWWQPWAAFREGFSYRKRRCRLWLAQRILAREYDRIREALGGLAHRPADQGELRRLAQPFYSPRLAGGEGHLEVAKTVYYTQHKLAHMVLGLKPFGCMPSTQSDGAQAAVTGRYPDILYAPIETSGEGDINAYSRVQMVLGEAKARCRDEFAEAAEQTGYSVEEIRRYCAERAELRRPLQHIPHRGGSASVAASFLLHAAEQMRRDPGWRRGAVPDAVAVETDGR